MADLDARRVELLAQKQAAPPPRPRLHPNLAELYRKKVINLAEALNDEDSRLEAAECLRALIEEIRLVPEDGKLRVELSTASSQPLSTLQTNTPAPRERGCK